ADSDYSSRDRRADGQFELLSPSVFATPLLCDCNADNLREEFVLGLSSAKPAYLLSAPLWARLLPEHSHYSLVIASASGRLFAHRFDAQANRFVSLIGFPVLLGSILHPPLLLSRLQPSNEKQHQQSPTTLSSSSSSSSGSINLIIVSDSSSASVSAIDARGHVIWSTGRLVPTKSQGASMTPLTALHRAGQLYAVGFVPNNVESGYSNSNHNSNVIIGRLHLISVFDGQLRTVDVRLRTPASEFLLSNSPHQHSLVEPMSRLTPFACQLKPSADRTHQLSSNAHRGTGDDAVTLLGGVDWLGRLATIDLSADLTEAGASLDFGLNATTALGLTGVNSQRTGLADLVVLTTEGRALSIRIQGAPYIEQSGSTLILPILIHDLLNPNALLSVVYTVRVHIYNKAVLSLRYPRPGPHLMYFDAGSRPLKSQLLLELTTSADARSAQAQATLVANVNYVYELPFLLYLPVSLTLLLLLGQVFTVEDNLQLPFVARHSD
uniref:ER membrane protein complex subunit 1 n=1 Tax=Macrostomum lignano TaxID=282301 RepID=A0A1I8HTQ4_9PLAT